jgi:hypothetical protein
MRTDKRFLHKTYRKQIKKISGRIKKYSLQKKENQSVAPPGIEPGFKV